MSDHEVEAELALRGLLVAIDRLAVRMVVAVGIAAVTLAIASALWGCVLPDFTTYGFIPPGHYTETWTRTSGDCPDALIERQIEIVDGTPNEMQGCHSSESHDGPRWSIDRDCAPDGHVTVTETWTSDGATGTAHYESQCVSDYAVVIR